MQVRVLPLFERCVAQLGAMLEVQLLLPAKTLIPGHAQQQTSFAWHTINLRLLAPQLAHGLQAVALGKGHGAHSTAQC